MLAKGWQRQEQLAPRQASQGIDATTGAYEATLRCYISRCTPPPICVPRPDKSRAAQDKVQGASLGEDVNKPNKCNSPTLYGESQASQASLPASRAAAFSTRPLRGTSATNQWPCTRPRVDNSISAKLGLILTRGGLGMLVMVMCGVVEGCCEIGVFRIPTACSCHLTSWRTPAS